MTRSTAPRRRGETTPPQGYADTVPQPDRAGSHDFLLGAIYDLKGTVAEIGQKVDSGVDRLDRKIDDVERRLEAKIEGVDKRIECLDGKIGTIEHHVSLVKGIVIAIGAVVAIVAFLITTWVTTGARIEFAPKAEPDKVEAAPAGK